MDSASDDDNGPDDKIACRNARGQVVIVSRKDLIFRPGAYAVIERDSKVLAMRSKYGRYFLPGGGQDKGETLTECLLREVREETGLEIRVGHYLGVFEEMAYWNDVKQGLHVHAHGYVAYLSHGVDFKPGIGNDVEGYPQWVDLHYLRTRPDKLQTPAVGRMLHAYLYGVG